MFNPLVECLKRRKQGRAENQRARRADPADVRGAAPHPGKAPGVSAGGTGYDLILAYFWRAYEPAFRRGTSAYATKLNREVKANEATWAPPRELLDLLAGATDAPRDKEGAVKRHGLPQFFNTWAKSAWVDLLNGLPDEEKAEVVSGEAEEEFRAHLAGALGQLVTIGETVYEGGKQVQRAERRSLLHWCARFARGGPWKSIRSFACWCRIEETAAGTPRLAVAVRADLFKQLPYRPLAELTPTRFARLCAAYGAGVANDGERPQGRRAVVLEPAFLDGLLADPDQSEGTEQNTREGG